MTQNEANSWFERREGQYFCTNVIGCWLGVARKEAFALDDSSEGTYYHCDTFGQNVILPSHAEAPSPLGRRFERHTACAQIARRHMPAAAPKFRAFRMCTVSEEIPAQALS